MARGLEAVRALLEDAAPFAPARTVVVATSAVRDASNGADFCERVRAATGQTIRILTGEEEANLIARGLTCDPILAALTDLLIFTTSAVAASRTPAFRQSPGATGREPRSSVAFALTEKFIPDPTRRVHAGTAAPAHRRLIAPCSHFPLRLRLQPAAGIPCHRHRRGRSPPPVPSSPTSLESPWRLRRPSWLFPRCETSCARSAHCRWLLASRSLVCLAEKADVFPTALATLVAVCCLRQNSPASATPLQPALRSRRGGARSVVGRIAASGGSGYRGLLAPLIESPDPTTETGKFSWETCPYNLGEILLRARVVGSRLWRDLSAVRTVRLATRADETAAASVCPAVSLASPT